VVVRPDGSRRLCAAKRASVARDFYAFVGENGQLDQSVEVGIGPIEAAGAHVGRAMVAGTFPPSDPEKLEFAGFLALQATRGAAFRSEWERLVASHGAVPLRNFTIDTMLKDLAQLANIFLRMRWRLCRFAEPALFTGDQPVVYKRRGTSPRFFEGIGPMTVMRFGLSSTRNMRSF
jgi:hypothetical protein